MKKGKTSKIIGFRSVKVTYGTVDALNLKSVYLNLQTWVEPKKESTNWQRIVLNKSRQIRHTILMNSDKQLFDDKFIVDMDLRSSGLVLGKKSFLNLEITLFLNQTNIDFKSKKLKDSLKKLTKTIMDEILSKDEHFKLHLRKTNKKIQKGEESQDI